MRTTEQQQQALRDLKCRAKEFAAKHSEPDEAEAVKGALEYGYLDGWRDCEEQAAEVLRGVESADAEQRRVCRAIIAGLMMQKTIDADWIQSNEERVAVAVHYADWLLAELERTEKEGNGS